MTTQKVYERFAMDALLGQDRFGSVYAASDQGELVDGAPRRVALRLLPAALTRSQVAIDAFRRDFERVRGLKHANVPRLLEFGYDGATCFVTTELLDGETLRSVLSHLHPERLELSEADDLIATVGDVLVTAHDRGIFHGDIRPETVLVTTDHEIKVLNFECTGLLRSGALALDPVEDVRALASMAYELYTGESVPEEWASRHIRRLPRRRRQALRRTLVEAPRPHSIRIGEFLEEAGLPVAVWIPSSLAEVPPPALEREHGERRYSVGAAVLAAAVLAGAAALLVDRGADVLGDFPGSEAGLDVSDGAGSAASRSTAGPQAASSQGALAANGATALPAQSGNHQGLGAADEPLDARRLGEGSPVAFERGAAVAQEAGQGAAGADARGALSFSAETLTAFESRSPLSVDVHRTGDIGQPLEFTWWTRDGTARDGDDYARFGRRPEAFAAGERTRTLYIPIAADNLREEDEQFFIEIDFDPSNSGTDTIITAAVIVIDDDR